MKSSYTDRLIEEAARRSAVNLEVPETYLGFLEWLGVRPNPYQRVFCAVAYDGWEPGEFDGDDRRMARDMFGAVDEFDPRHRHAIFALAGGRAGKTYLFGALRLVWGAYTRDLSSLAPGQRAVALCVGPKDVHRQEIINYQLGAIRSRPELRSTIIRPRYLRDDDTPESFAIKRPDGHIVTFEGGTANRGGYGGRGRSLTDCLLDEMAFFQDASHVVNDKEIFKASSPRVLPGGQMIAQTTAWAKAGYHYDRWAENHLHPMNAIAARATTEQLRPDAAEMVDRERATDPENARREFDAEPEGSIPKQFLTEEEIAACFDPSLSLPRAPSAPDGIYPEEHLAGGDAAMSSNSSAIVIGHRSQRETILAHVREMRPQGVPLRPSAVGKQFADDCAAHKVTMLMTDGHYREALREHTPPGLAIIAAPVVPAEAAVKARAIIRDGRFRMPHPDHLPEPERGIVKRLVKQLKEVRGTKTAGGGMTITMPLWADGSHGDIAAALFLMLFQVQGETEKAPPPAMGTVAWEENERAKRRAMVTGKRR